MNLLYRFRNEGPFRSKIAHFPIPVYLTYRYKKKLKIRKAYQMLGIIKRNFIYLTPDSFVVLYKAIVRCHLEHAVSVWNPHHQLLIEILEMVHKKGHKISYC